MHAIVLHQPGTAASLNVEEVPTPTVKPGWSLLQVKGFGINRSEIFTRNGWSPSVQLPRILGIEAVGVIATTTDPKRLPIGQTAVTLMGGLGRAFDGGYAEYTLVPNQQLYPVQTTLTWPELAAIPETYYTAYGSLETLQLNKNDTLLIRGATSGVGIAAAKLARALHPNITLIGSTRHLEKQVQLKAAGFDHVILDQNNQLQREQTTFTKILELIGPLTMQDSLQALARQGIMCVTGELGGVWTADGFDPISQIPSGAYLTGFSSDNITEAQFQTLLDLIVQHQIDVTPTRVFDLAHTGAAQAFLEQQTSFGKVVVLPGSTL
ncbi:zinc-binding dehydrogenase [Loigolactobacillus bifermentans]|uniref:Alcohol dehydrogenase GroES domain-containing protein n=1 Tax=Loigolactobacillus bifermentans DSM 20003 TaxID=1423726 RepID=A0A0R1GZ19_9LACO|nr:zinc-binding dehydrogenase [Loigolactobacillus bifermentans]KRK39628.1 alcohol dehydrogenase GroES domain-containing protein [Loigolactobacillus bifermentans DSM 20003]QGG60749.1 zinc-binding dehydrogenase [Loigolactobacillus bifermentans]